MKKLATFVCVLVFVVSIGCFGGCKNKQNNITEYQIDCTLSGNVLTGEEKVIFYNAIEYAFTELKFYLYTNAFRKDAKFKPIATQYNYVAYPDGLSYGNIEINSVSDGKKQLDYRIEGLDQNILTVCLEKEIFPNESATVVINYTINLASVIARTGVNEKTINLANFYPVLCAISNGAFYECEYYSTGDPYFSDVADYVVNITVQEDFVVATSGVQESVKVDGGLKTVQSKIQSARSFAIVLSKNFKLLEDTVDGISVKYYYYEDEQPTSAMEYAKKSLSLFNKLFGKYPYQCFTIVKTPFVQGGMEFPSLVMISDNLESDSFGEVIVHETAHQWWQSVVGNNEIEYGFLDEGLAEYSVVLFYENHPEYNLTREYLVRSAENTYKIFCSVYDKINKQVNTVMLRSLKEFTSEYEYVNMAYIKPCIMYDKLRVTIGEEKFFNSLKSYYKNYKMKNATPDDLVGAFEKTGADTNGFFKSFFEGKVII